MQNKVIDSLINDEALWARNEEELDEKKAPWLDTSAIDDAVDVKGRAGVGVGEAPTSDWLDSLGTYDEDSVDDGQIIRVRVDMIKGGAGTIFDENLQ